MKNWIKIKEKIKRFFKNEYTVAFLTIYLVGIICFSFTAAGNSFTLPMYGDYHLQTYAFYSQGYHVFWDFIKHGQFPMFDFSNYLGANYIGTQSFYYLFSPLFYILCLCPEPLLYQGIFFHMVLKFALGGFFFYILLRKYFHISKKMSWAGGFIYSLSGFSLFYLWFHFGDAIAFFPLFIMGMEKLLKERKGWLLTLGLFLCGCANYLFLTNFAIFGVLYALFRWVQIYGINKKRGYSASVRWGVLLQGILFYAAGILLAGFVLMPSLFVVQATSRTRTAADYLVKLLSTVYSAPSYIQGSLVLGDIKSIKDIFSLSTIRELFNVIFKWEDRSLSTSTFVPAYQNVGYIITSWLFMNTNCWSSTMFSNVTLDNSIGGFFITTPMTMLLIPSIVNTIKQKRVWNIFGVVFVITMALIPFTAYSAFGFTNLYGRWQLWIVMIGIIYIISTLDKFEKVDRRFVTVGLGVNYALAYLVYQWSVKSGHYPNSDYIAVFIGEVIFMAVVWAVYRFKLFKPAVVKYIMIFFIVGEIAVSTTVTVEHKGYYNWNNYYMSQDSFDEMQDMVGDLQDEDRDFYRMYNSEGTRALSNFAYTLNYKGAGMFNSSYDFELNDFIRRSRAWYSGSWSMGDHEKRYYYHQYIGIKYYVVDKMDPNNDNVSFSSDPTEAFDGRSYANPEKQSYRQNIPWGYTLFKEGKYYDIYINENNIGIGYTLDSAISASRIGTNSRQSSEYEQMYTELAIIENDDIDNLPSDVEIKESYYNSYTDFSRSRWDVYFSPREDSDAARAENMVDGKYTRQKYLLNTISGTINAAEVKKHLFNEVDFLHKRWEEYDRFGDSYIMEAKNNEYMCPVASDDNICYLNMQFKIGPQTLISLYNDDVLVTQDAHMVGGSINAYNSEWKVERGFYVNQPINKIVIEYVADTAFDRAFANGTSINVPSFKYTYQNNIQAKYDEINENLLYDVEYNTNNFKFKTNASSKRVAVTNIPYDEGWTLKSQDKTVDIIKVNGGFVGFITESGEVEYELSYFTPELKKGAVISLFGLLMFIALWFVYKNKRIEVLTCESSEALIYYTKQEAQEKEEIENSKQMLNDTVESIKNFFKKLFRKK